MLSVFLACYILYYFIILYYVKAKVDSLPQSALEFFLPVSLNLFLIGGHMIVEVLLLSLRSLPYKETTVI